MTPQELRASIIQQAVQGKLVEQRPDEGTGEELFQKIQAEKQALIKAGKIKKEKPLAEIAEDESPFDIPDTWKWIRLGSVVSVLGGKRIPAGRTLTTEDTGYKYIRVSDMKNGSVLVDNLLYVPRDIYPSISRYIINKEDVYLTVAGTIGKVGKIPEEIDGANLTENADRLVFQLIDQDWLIKCLESSLVQQQIIDATTKVGQPKLAIWRIQELLIPFPPLAEQKRIVAKLEEILPMIDRYEAAWNKLEEFNKRFPGDMQKSILQLAIQGKLVEQRPDEGTGEELFQKIQAEKQALIKAGKIKNEKPLAEITEDESPFEIPSTWKWVPLRNICQADISYGIIKLGNEDPSGVRVLRCSDVKENYIVSDTVRTVEKELSQQFSRTILQGGEIVINVRGTLGGCAVVPDEMRGYNVAREVAVIRQCEPVDAQYIVYLLMSDYFQRFMFHGLRGIAYKGLNMGTLAALPVPLPPLAEQKRIVAKLEEILPLCDRLK